MKRMFLASEFSVSGDKIIDFINIKNYKKIAYIGNAADNDTDNSWSNENKDKFIELGFQVKNFDLRKYKEESYKELQKYDGMYFEGGDTYYLLDLCKKIGLSDKIKLLVEDEGKLYIGTSAGSIIAGPNIRPSAPIEFLDKIPEEKSLNGFGLVNFMIIPHIGNRFFFKENEAEYSELFKEVKNYSYPYIVLRDEHAVWVEGEKIEII